MGFLKKYIFFYTIFVGLMISLLTWHRKTSFSDQKLSELLNATGGYKGQTKDPCLYSVIGEPETPGQYVKLTFKCDDKEARFSLDYAGIKNKTVAGAINELFHLNGVVLDLSELTCRQGGRLVAMIDKIQAQDNIECTL